MTKMPTLAAKKDVPTTSDDEHAARLRDELQAALEPVCAILTDAKKAGFIINFALGEQDGIHKMTSLNIIKQLLTQ